ncbi:hypothetical protein, partial [Rikenella microfusus]|uniref:hypothetical protein n=1 Tax=Rikenella microfusus TaxID=28139 RepID=UPI003AB6303E
MNLFILSGFIPPKNKNSARPPPPSPFAACRPPHTRKAVRRPPRPARPTLRSAAPEAAGTEVVFLKTDFAAIAAPLHVKNFKTKRYEHQEKQKHR